MTTQSASPKQSSTTGRIKAFYNANPWRGRLILILLSLILLIGIARLVLAPTIIYGATSWLKGQGIDSTIEDININLFNGNISLINAQGHQDGSPLFNIGLIEIHWHWSPLSKKSAVVTKVLLDKLKVDIDQYSDEMIIGGVQIPLNSSPDQIQEESEPDEKVKPWSASLGEVVFTNLEICYMQDSGPHANTSKETRFIDYCVDLKEMTWGGTIGYGMDPALLKTDDLAISSTGHFNLHGLSITDNRLKRLLLTSSSNTLTNVSISGLNKIHIDELKMNELSALERDDEKHKHEARFKQLTINEINFNNLNSLKINAVNLDGTEVFMVKLSETEWEYIAWIPKMPGTENSPVQEGSEPEKQQNETASEFEFSINNIQVKNSDICYLETANKLHYCFIQKNLDWKGSVNTTTGSKDLLLSINGDLTASDTKIRNQNLERDLLDIKSVSLNNLKVSDIDKASFEAFSIDSFSALQRGKKTSDSTASFSNLTVNKVNYASNNITIDTIELTGLSSLVSKNKDGSWEFDKWLSSKPEAKAEAEVEAKAETNEETGSETMKTEAADSKPADNSEPLLLSVNSVTIKTKKDLLFVDNSTKPSMEVGLKKLDFNIKNLNPNKPKTDSPFKLFGKTKRHGTIDLAGTVRPYAEKISLDAKGKLKGFEMRAATPATKKAIGHIIKSGQLDADLELLAVDGQLDSNIGLSLYKFHIKPMSKEDTKKLDSELGLPLNQTLVLLRDKDDSIHLDIPITGDINNPDFNPMDAIVKATTKAATVTLITFYTPYGLIYAGGNVLFDLATAMNFDPIPFDPGSSKLPAEGEKKLDNLAKLLTEKPQVHLSMCGMTNMKDVYALYPKLKKDKTAEDKKTDDKKAKGTIEVKLNEDQSAAIKKLAQDRQTNSKTYLIEKTKIGHDRLILCAPEHNSEEDALAGVEINI